MLVVAAGRRLCRRAHRACRCARSRTPSPRCARGMPRNRPRLVASLLARARADRSRCCPSPSPLCATPPLRIPSLPTRVHPGRPRPPASLFSGAQPWSPAPSRVCPCRSRPQRPYGLRPQPHAPAPVCQCPLRPIGPMTAGAHAPENVKKKKKKRIKNKNKNDLIN